LIDAKSVTFFCRFSPFSKRIRRRHRGQGSPRGGFRTERLRKTAAEVFHRAAL
jgi:hypothetical protein